MSLKSELKEKFGIEITNDQLLEQALTHTSYYNEHRELKHGDNERLEFMGDAVLQLWTTDKLFNAPQHFPEGKMTTLRSQLVREEALSTYAKSLGWNQYLLLGVGEEKTGGRQRDSIIADMFEAVLGAIYLDCGYDCAASLLNCVITHQLAESSFELIEDYKTKLQEFIQADTRKSVTYETTNSYGPGNAPTFEVCVSLDGVILGEGVAGTKKKAEQLAAKQALIKLAK